MNTVRFFCIAASLLWLSAVVPVEAASYRDGSVNASRRAEQALGGDRVRLFGSGSRRRDTDSPPPMFSGRAIDPYELGPTIDGVQVDAARMIAAVKRRLTARGYPAGPANGQWTDTLEQALRKYQAEVSGASSGLIDSYTLENLGLSVAQFAK